MSWLPDWLTGYDQANATRAAAADAELRRLNQQRPRDGLQSRERHVSRDRQKMEMNTRLLLLVLCLAGCKSSHDSGPLVKATSTCQAHHVAGAPNHSYVLMDGPDRVLVKVYRCETKSAKYPHGHTFKTYELWVESPAAKLPPAAKSKQKKGK